MNVVSRLADRRPIIFVLLVLLVWYALWVAIIHVSNAFSPIELPAYYLETVGMLGSTGILLLFVVRLGWFRKLSITDFGTKSAWVLTLMIGVYLVASRFYAYFGDGKFDVRWVVDFQGMGVWVIVFFLWGFIEEFLFRGVLLFALFRVLGKTNRGMITAVVIQAALFGVFHAYWGDPSSLGADTVMRVLDASFSGILLGALVLRCSSLWPAILLHTTLNIFIAIKGVHTPLPAPLTLGYLLSVLAILPPIGIGFWGILKVDTVPAIPHPLEPDPVRVSSY